MKRFTKVITPMKDYSTISRLGNSYVVHLEPLENPEDNTILCYEYMLNDYPDIDKLNLELQEWKEYCILRDLENAKKLKTLEIYNYDKSETINSIIINGKKIWIPANLRAILKTSIDAYKALGFNEITKVWEGIEYTTTADKWLLMIAEVEVYASECYNTTAKHKAAIEVMDNIEDVEAFDITAGYPEMLEFNI